MAETAHQWHGPEDAPVVALAHGLGLNRAMWQWTLPALARWRVLTYDLWAHGASPPPPEEPSLTLLARQLADLLAGRPAAVVGFSLGGMIARRFAMDFPSQTRALAILHSPHLRTQAQQQAIRDRVERARREGPAATVEAALERWFTPACRAARPDLMALVRGWVLANDPAHYHRIYRVLAEGVAEIAAPAITCPALVITGADDHGNGPEMTRAIAAGIPGAEALVLPGLRHMAPAEAPDAVNVPLAAFLARHLRSPADAA